MRGGARKRGTCPLTLAPSPRCCKQRRRLALPLSLVCSLGGGHNKHGTGSRCTLPKQCRPPSPRRRWRCDRVTDRATRYKKSQCGRTLKQRFAMRDIALFRVARSPLRRTWAPMRLALTRPASASRLAERGLDERPTSNGAVRERVEPAHLGGRCGLAPTDRPLHHPRPGIYNAVRQVRHRAPPRYTKCACGRTLTDHRSQRC